MPKVTEKYLIRGAAYGRSGRDVSTAILWSLAQQGVAPRGLQDWFTRVLIMHEIMPTAGQGSSMRLRRIVEWLVLNGHEVSMYVRKAWALDIFKNEIGAWVRSSGVRLVTDNEDLQVVGFQRRVLFRPSAYVGDSDAIGAFLDADVPTI